MNAVLHSTGHMYCAPCIASYIAHRRGQGCPRCGKALPPIPDHTAPEDVLQTIYANTQCDLSDEWIRRAYREWVAYV